MKTGTTAWALIALVAGFGLSATDARAAPPSDGDVRGENRDLANPQLKSVFRSPQDMPRATTRRGPDKWPPAVKAIFIGATGGLGYASFKHGELGQTKLVGPVLSFQLGYRLSQAWAVSVVYSDFQRGVSRGSGGELFGAATSLFRTQADCTSCKDPLPGGVVLSTTFRIDTVGAAVDFTPLGKNGPFVGAMAGMAMAGATETAYGVAGAARAGLRYRPARALSLGVEGGVQGQKYTGGSAAIGYGAAEMRLSF